VSERYCQLKNRIVMLTPDGEIIDRRILQQANTLIRQGKEVILIAANNGELPVHEEIDGVKIHRPIWNKQDPRFEKQYKTTEDLYEMFYKRIQRIKTDFLRGIHKVFPFKIAETIADYPFKLTLKLLKSIRKRIIKVLNKQARALTERTMKSGYHQFFENVILSYRPDCIHVHDLPSLVPGVGAKEQLAKKQLNVPLIYDAHEFYPEDPALSEDKKELLRKLEAKFIKKPDGLMTVNDVLAKEMENRYGGISYVILQNAVDPPKDFNPSVQYDLFREEFNLPKDSFLLLFQGWVSPHRNLDFLVRGMEPFRGSKFILLMMGYGDYRNELYEIVNELDLHDNVKFIPAKPQEELIFYSASANLGVIPYPNDKGINSQCCSPNKLYEFIVAGTPILANELPFVRKVIEGNGFGKCFNLQSSQGVSKALETFPFEQMDAFRSNIQTHRHKFTWEYESQKMLELYRRIWDETPSQRN